MPHCSIATYIAHRSIQQHRSVACAQQACTRTRFSTAIRSSAATTAHASTQHAAWLYVTGRRDLVSTLFMMRRRRTAFVSQRARRLPTLLHAKQL
jgi:hypothetical protein